jgi:nicotinamide-nucleotide amidase
MAIGGKNLGKARLDVGRWLKALAATVATAESCTGGGLGWRLTAKPGSSAYFVGGIIAYDNAVKIRLLGVRPSTLARCGAVSGPVAAEMAQGVRRRLKSRYGISVTGIAGPGGGTAQKPVGRVFIGVADPLGCCVKQFQLHGGRAAVRRAAVDAGLAMLADRLKRSLKET